MLRTKEGELSHVRKEREIDAIVDTKELIEMSKKEEKRGNAFYRWKENVRGYKMKKGMKIYQE